MILTRTELKETIAYEKCLYQPKKKRDRYLAIISNDFTHRIFNYVKILRNSEYHLNNCSYKTRRSIRSLYHDFMYIYYRTVRNIIGTKLGFEIYENNFGKGLLIYHNTGGILMNGSAKVGENCCLHGNNRIGNKGGYNSGTPIIGDNVDIGYGAIIIGDVIIGNNVKIAAGSVVINSFPEDNVVIGGIPARVLRRNLIK